MASLIQFQSSFFYFCCLAGIITVQDEQSGNPCSALSLCWQMCWLFCSVRRMVKSKVQFSLFRCDAVAEQAMFSKSLIKEYKTITSYFRYTYFRITASATVKVQEAAEQCNYSLVSGLTDWGRMQVLLFQLPLIGLWFNPSISQTDRLKWPAVKALSLASTHLSSTLFSALSCASQLNFSSHSGFIEDQCFFSSPPPSAGFCALSSLFIFLSLFSLYCSYECLCL